MQIQKYDEKTEFVAINFECSSIILQEILQGNNI